MIIKDEHGNTNQHLYTDILTSRDETIKLAAAIETKSSHPLAACIVNHYSGCITDKIDNFGVAVGLPEVTDFKNHDGMGLSGNAGNNVVCVGNLDLMTSFEIEVGENVRELMGEWSMEGCTVIMVGVNGKVRVFYYLPSSLTHFYSIELLEDVSKSFCFSSFGAVDVRKLILRSLNQLSEK